MQFIIQYEPFSSPNALLITSFKSSECSICSSSIFHRHRPLLHWYHRVVISILGLIRICKAVRVFNAVYRVRKSGGRKRTHIKTHNVCAPSLHYTYTVYYISIIHIGRGCRPADITNYYVHNVSMSRSILLSRRYLLDCDIQPIFIQSLLFFIFSASRYSDVVAELSIHLYATIFGYT